MDGVGWLWGQPHSKAQSCLNQHTQPTPKQNKYRQKPKNFSTVYNTGQNSFYPVFSGETSNVYVSP